MNLSLKKEERLTDPAVQRYLHNPINILIDYGYPTEDRSVVYHNSPKNVIKLLENKESYNTQYLQNGNEYFKDILPNVDLVICPGINFIANRPSIELSTFSFFICHNSVHNYLQLKEIVDSYVWDLGYQHRKRRFDDAGDECIVLFSVLGPKMVKARSLDTIWLPDKIKKPIVSQMETFFSKEEREFRKIHGIAHKLAYVFSGPPGTGKTSFVRALASHFYVPIVYLSLTSEEDSIKRLTNTPSPCIILIEDIDTMVSSLGGPESPHSKMSVAGFLNILDGIESQENVITIITCNDAKILGLDAMRRGRIDHIVSFENMTVDSITNMLRSFYPTVPVEDINTFVKKFRSGRQITPNDLQHYILENRDCFEKLKKVLESSYCSSVQYRQSAQDHNATLMTSYRNPFGTHGYM